MKKSSLWTTLALFLLGSLSLQGARSQIAYELVRNRNLRPRFGGPNIVQQVEFMQNAVGMVQEYINSKSSHGGHKNEERRF
jgi:hypothetical protein